MKTKSKALLLTLCAVLLVAASILGTMAYLTSQDTVTNTFTVGNVEITLDEAKVGPDGQALTEDNAERVKANTYKLMPGHEYDKDPTIHVAANSEDCYLFVEVKNGIADIEDSNPYGTITEQMTGTSGNWVALKGYSGIYFYSLSSETPITKPTVVSASNAEDGVKDPKVTVKANSEACWLFVKLDKSANFDTYLTYEMADGWIQLEDDKEGPVEGVFYRQVSLATTDQEFSVLKDNQVKVKGSVTKTQMDAAETNYPTLTVTAYAHQYSKDGSNYFGVYDAWKELNS